MVGSDARKQFLNGVSADSEAVRSGGHEASARKPIRLSPREIEVAMAVTRGWSNKQIAKELGLSSHTVSVYLSSALRKCDVTSRTELALLMNNSFVLGQDVLR